MLINFFSVVVALLADVPKGTLFGHFVFTMYTSPLGITTLRHAVKYYLYAVAAYVKICDIKNYKSER